MCTVFNETKVHLITFTAIINKGLFDINFTFLGPRKLRFVGRKT